MDSEFDRAKLIALKYIGIDPGRPIRKVVQKLAKAECKRETIKAVVLDLVEAGLLDERLYCQRMYNRHSGIKQKSKMVLRNMMLAKGITPSTVKKFMATVPEDDITIHNYFVEYFRRNRLEDEAKLFRRLQQRGYNYYLIRQALKKYQED